MIPIKEVKPKSALKYGATNSFQISKLPPTVSIRVSILKGLSRQNEKKLCLYVELGAFTQLML